MAKTKKLISSEYNAYMIDLHIANACNLTCDGCNHWSNYGFKEKFSYDTIKSWLVPWKDKLSPQRFNILGGEPLLNKDAEKIIYLCKEVFPLAKHKFYTNALLLKNHTKWLFKALKDNDVSLVITLHSRNSRYLNLLKKNLAELKTWGDFDFKKETWFRKLYDISGVEVEIRDMKSHWYKTYTGNGYNARPFADKQPKKSWEECVSKDSIQLYHGALYKCGPIAYLNDFLNKYSLTDNEEWLQYSKYKPLLPNCSDEKLFEFLNREEEFICNMCPANPNRVIDKEIFVKYEY